jgi:hypothetical protein
MLQQKSYTGREVLKISFFAGLILYIPALIYMYLIGPLWYYGVILFGGIMVFIFSVSGLLIWLGSIIFMIKSFRKLGIPKTPFIIGLGSFTSICFTMLLSIVFGYPAILVSIFVYPLIYGGYDWLFNRVLPTLEKK